MICMESWRKRWAIDRNKRVWEWHRGNWKVTIPEWVPFWAELFGFDYDVMIPFKRLVWF